MTARLATAAAVLVLAVATGCASVHGGKARARNLARALDEHRYARPLPDVWQEARRLLDEQGYPLAGADAKAVGKEAPGLGSRVLSPARETRPYDEEQGLLQQLGVAPPPGERALPGSVSLDTGWRRTRDRYRVDGLVDERGARVVFFHVTEDLTEHRSIAVRDPEQELALLRRVDPEAAAAVEAAAK